jgi:pyrimidine and pyridine-specific 5'-nucleotidase
MIIPHQNLRPRTPLPLTNSAPNAPSLSHFILPPSTSSAELSEFDELSIRRALRSLPQVSRTTLLRIILESSMPGDISSMIRILQKYLLTSFDILGSLPEELAVEVLSRFDVEEVLGFATVSRANLLQLLIDIDRSKKLTFLLSGLLSLSQVSRKWNELINHPLLWRHYALLISWTDPVPPKDPDQPSGWLPLYRALHFRERNWEKVPNSSASPNMFCSPKLTHHPCPT